MSALSKVRNYFDKQSIEYEKVDHPTGLDIQQLAEHLGIHESQVLRCECLKSDSKRYLAVLPYSYLLDFEVLRSLVDQSLVPLEREKAAEQFKAEYLFEPAVPGAFSLTGVVDNAVFQEQPCYLRTGHDGQLLKIESDAIKALFADSDRLSFACGPDKLYSGRNAQEDLADTVNQFTPMRIKQRIDETFDLPSMPDIAQDIMRLRVDPAADAKKLAQIVSRDPSLTAQIISWASSPYYGYKGTVDSVETAVSRVLGFDMVMNLALGISIGKSFKVPEQGPLGLLSFWQKAVYAANLVEKLCLMIPVKHRPERGLAYLAGLLHNFGQLLIGHLFPPQFKLISAYIEVNPTIALEDVEHFVLGVTHQEIGAWLMQNWHMPEELIVAVRWHNHEEFWSNHAAYSNLVLLANRLLRRIRLSCSTDTQLPESILSSLSLDHEAVDASFEKLLLERDSLDQISKQLVA